MSNDTTMSDAMYVKSIQEGTTFIIQSFLLVQDSAHVLRVNYHPAGGLHDQQQGQDGWHVLKLTTGTGTG